MTTTIQQRRGTAAQATTANEVLLAGQLGVETDTGKAKIGNGTTAWNGLPYIGGSSSSSVLTRTAVKSANYTVAVGEYVPCDASGGSFTVTLPTAPADKSEVAAKIVLFASPNVVTIACGGSDKINRTGGPTSTTLVLLGHAATLQYDTASATWTIIAVDVPVGQLDARYKVAAQTIAYAATVTPNADLGEVANVGALTGNVSIANPTGTPLDGQRLRFRLAQDSTGGRTVAFGTAYVFGTDVTAALIPSTASATYEITFSWHATSAKWRALAIARGF